MTASQMTKTARSPKLKALLAGGAVLGLGATVTLAAWTDTEWVFGGNAAGDGPGIGTSVFEVEQNVDAPFTEAGFTQAEANPGQAMTFGLSALSLTPGDSVYAPVALRTIDDSIAGTLSLDPAVPADGIAVTDADQALWGALDLRVAVLEGDGTTTFTCDATTFTGAAVTIVADGPLATAGASDVVELDADSGNTAYFCFEITLPDAPTLPTGFPLAELQGRSAAPAWNFPSVSE
ncbi:SipW-dependent-type signal peptide-containing protein [Sanguibacter suaedae]|uniref:Acyl-CoA dehydrogenase n=1 Tax=Sanguibacter suaedae TaxID=2795737 RepID=A0A934MBT2_9MICO|nr:SipW-dependent-type signal peptide-containing protein [Sanguibacter suaedae]MBI9115646.1 acyl-CoA dehydrogenase [Sanguibacter suaedae]